MEPQIGAQTTCPNCGLPITAGANYCPNCGRKLKEKEVSTGMWALLWLFFVSVFLPPFGLGLTLRYLKSTDKTIRVFGIISLLLTVGVLVWAIWSVLAVLKSINQMVNQQLSLPGGGF
jgi:uncharacterized OB-fold protein